MKLRSIPLCTCLSLMRERRFTRDWANNIKTVEPSIAGKRSQMRKQISRKPFEGKLAKWQEELDELSQWADEGLDVSKIKKSIEERIKGLLDLLEGSQ